MIRTEPLLAPDAPLADRWQQLGEDIEAHGREIDRVLREHRANMIARYGLPADHFTSGPARDSSNSSHF